MNSTKQPGLIDAPIKPDQTFNEQQWTTQVTESLRLGLGQTGDQSQKFVTWSDMEEAGMVEISTSGSGGNGGGGFEPAPITQPPDLTPPPPLENVAASGGMTAIYITWDNPLLSYNYYVEVHKASEDDVGKAVLIGTTNGQIYEHVVGSDTNSYYFWVRVIKQTGGTLVIGPWQSTYGVLAAAAQDPAWVLDQVSGRFDTDDLATQVFNVDLFGVKSPDPDVETFAFVVDTTADPPYVAMNGAYIQDATITDAKIGSLNVDKLIGGTAQFVEANILDATITNAKIGNVIQSDNYVANSSGWTLNKDGYFETQNALIRGRIHGSEITGSVIQGSVIIGDDEILIVTEADGGPGTIRHLTYLEPFSVTSNESHQIPGLGGGHVTTPVTLRMQASNIKSYNYTGDGNSGGIWLNNRRYKYYKINPEVKFSTTKMSFIHQGNASNGVYHIKYTISVKGSSEEITFNINKVWKSSNWYSFSHSASGFMVVGRFKSGYDDERPMIDFVEFDVICTNISFSGNENFWVNIDAEYTRSGGYDGYAAPAFESKINFEDFSYDKATQMLSATDREVMSNLENVYLSGTDLLKNRNRWRSELTAK